jgi:carotenoid cleavage dioxygenase-like enzyme
MTNSTIPVNGGAISKVDRKFVMTRAWAIFRQIYKYPQIKFSDIGRRCFAWALRQAWVEAREAARVAAMTPAAKAERIETLQSLIQHAGFIDSGRLWKATITAHRDEIRQLQAA